MEQPGIDSQAKIHPRQQRSGVTEIEILGEIVDAARVGVTGERSDPLMHPHVARRATEEDVAATVDDEPVHDAGHPLHRPFLLHRRRTGSHEYPGPSGRTIAEDGVDLPPRVVGHPVLVVAVIDRDRIGPEEVEEHLHFVPVFADPDRAREEHAPSLIGKANAMPDPRKPHREEARHRPLEDIGAVIVPGPQPGRIGPQPC